MWCHRVFPYAYLLTCVQQGEHGYGKLILRVDGVSFAEIYTIAIHYNRKIQYSVLHFILLSSIYNLCDRIVQLVRYGVCKRSTYHQVVEQEGWMVAYSTSLKGEKMRARRDTKNFSLKKRGIPVWDELKFARYFSRLNWKATREQVIIVKTLFWESCREDVFCDFH